MQVKIGRQEGVATVTAHLPLCPPVQETLSRSRQPQADVGHPHACALTVAPLQPGSRCSGHNLLWRAAEAAAPAESYKPGLPSRSGDVSGNLYHPKLGAAAIRASDFILPGGHDAPDTRVIA